MKSSALMAPWRKSASAQSAAANKTIAGQVVGIRLDGFAKHREGFGVIEIETELEPAGPERISVLACRRSGREHEDAGKDESGRQGSGHL